MEVTYVGIVELRPDHLLAIERAFLHGRASIFVSLEAHNAVIALQVALVTLNERDGRKPSAGAPEWTEEEGRFYRRPQCHPWDSKFDVPFKQ